MIDGLTASLLVTYLSMVKNVQQAYPFDVVMNVTFACTFLILVLNHFPPFLHDLYYRVFAMNTRIHLIDGPQCEISGWGLLAHLLAL